MEEEEIGSGQRGGWGKVWEEKGRRNCFQDVKTNKQKKMSGWKIQVETEWSVQV